MSATASDAKDGGQPGQQHADLPHGPSNAWGDRVRALKNVPAVLHFVWESGPAVVSWNIGIRILVAA